MPGSSDTNQDGSAFARVKQHVKEFVQASPEEHAQ